VNLPKMGVTMGSSGRMMKNGLALAAILSGLAMSPGLAAAQEVQITGPLAGQPAVRHMREYRAGRFNLMPTVGYTLQDEFARSLFVGLEANYHFLEWLGVGIWGAYNPADIDTDLTSQIRAAGQTTDRNRLSLPSASQFSAQVGRIRWAVSAHLIFIPLRGKLSLFQAVFVDTDLYIFAGVAVMGVDERATTVTDGVRSTACDMPSITGQSTDACIATQTARSGRVLVAPMLGLGLSLYANSWFGIAFEWRAFPFSWNPSGTDESGFDANGQVGSGFPDGRIDGSDSRTTFNHMFQIGLIFNLPPDQQTTE
jgi:outer membrane beta-barrel protein